MHFLAFSDFIDKLQSQGIRPGIREYERLWRTLQTSSAWTLPKLRAVFVSLLARSPEQVKAVRRQFNRTFRDEIQEKWLTAFISALSAGKLHVSDHTKRELQHTIKENGAMTEAELRYCLIEKLCHDQQETAYLEEMFEQFKASAKPPWQKTGVDIRRFIADLQKLAKEPLFSIGTEQGRMVVRSRLLQKKAQTVRLAAEDAWVEELDYDESPKRRFPRWAKLAFAAGAITLVIFLLFNIFSDNIEPPGPEIQPSVGPRPQLTPQTLSFGSLEPGETVTKNFSIRNTGDSTFTVRRISWQSDPGSFSFAPPDSPFQLPAGQAKTFPVTFPASQNGDFRAALEIMTDVFASAMTLQLSVTVEEKVKPPETTLLYTDYPSITITTEPIAAGQWQLMAAGAVLLLILLVVQGVHLWRGAVPPRAKPFTTKAGDPDDVLHFDLGQLNIPLQSRLSHEDLDYIADLLGYFRTEEYSKIVNINQTVAATSDNAGFPEIRFEPGKRMRTFVILEERNATASQWNPIVQELVDGLTLRGVPLIHCQFNGTPDHVLLQGRRFELEDLQDDRTGQILLVFSDGRRLNRHKKRFFETLKTWPNVAWMHLCEPRFWGAESEWPQEFDIPVLPATTDGLICAMQMFLTETALPVTHVGRGPRVAQEISKAAELDLFLGQALPWAQACAIMQPLPPGLADKLRSGYFAGAHIPAGALERLYRLRGLHATADGLLFPPEIRDALRQGFHERFTRKQKAAIVAFFTRELLKYEPAERESRRWQAWKYRFEMCRLFAEPDSAVENLHRLHSSGFLTGALEGDFENLFMDGDNGEQINPAFKSLNGLDKINALRLDRLQGKPMRRLLQTPKLILYATLFVLSFFSCASLSYLGYNAWQAGTQIKYNCIQVQTWLWPTSKTKPGWKCRGAKR